MPTQKSAQKWCCDLSRLLAWKITKGIHSCKPALLNRPVQEICLLNTDFHKHTHAHTHTLKYLVLQLQVEMVLYWSVLQFQLLTTNLFRAYSDEDTVHVQGKNL